MAISDVYATAAEYRDHLDKTDTADDSIITTALTAVSRYLDRKLGWHFSKDASVVARTYLVPGARTQYRPMDWAESENPYRWGAYQRLLQVDPIASSSGLIIVVDTDQDGSFDDETAWAATDYVLLPRNADKLPEARPWTAIEVPPWSSQSGFIAGTQVRVTATWGWPAIPAAIKLATIELAALWRLETPRATSQMNASVDVVVSTSKQAQQIVGSLVSEYRKPGKVV